MALESFLNRYGQIQIIENTEKITPFYTEVCFRVLDNEFWNKCLEKLTKSFPDIYFIKRYVTKGDKFGFQWMMLIWGERDKDQLEQFCEEADNVVAMQSAKPVKQVTKETSKVPNKNDRKFHLSTKKLYNDNGVEIGEVRRVKLAGTSSDENTLNTMNHKDVPMVFQGSLEGMTSQILRRLGK